MYLYRGLAAVNFSTKKGGFVNEPSAYYYVVGSMLCLFDRDEDHV